MTIFKELKDKFATKEQAKRQDVLVWNKDFWQACRWFYKQGKKEAEIVSTFPRCSWQPIYELNSKPGIVLGRCGDTFSLVKAVRNFKDDAELSIMSVETGETFDAREFMVIPLNDRTEVEVTYSVKGLVLGISWEGVEDTYPLKEFTNLKDNIHIQEWYSIVLQGKHPLYKSLTGTGDFQRELGAILVITKSTTIQVNGKPFINTEVSREFIGDLSAEQMEELDNTMNW